MPATEARELRHSYVGTEHILLALLARGRTGTAADALTASGVTHAQVRAAVVRMMGLGVEDPAGELPFTGAGEDAIELRPARGVRARPGSGRHRAHPAGPDRGAATAPRRASCCSSTPTRRAIRAALPS